MFRINLIIVNLFIHFILGCGFSMAQNIDVLKGKYSIEWPASESMDAVKMKVKEKAIIHAIENYYGQVIIQGNATYIKNEISGTKVESKSSFNSIAETFVKGEVLRIISEKYTEIKEKRKLDGHKQWVREISCEIDFEAREVKENPILLKSYFSICEESAYKCKTTSFYDGDNVYLVFKSPKSGFLSVYLNQEIDGKQFTSRFLPIGSDNFEGGIPVKADKEYIFFSKKVEGMIEGFRSHDFMMKSIDARKELSRFYLLFSTKPIDKPELMHIQVSEEYQRKMKGFRIPPGIFTENFLHWLHLERISDKDLVLEIIDITLDKYRD
jgi:hypothetical protein